MKAHALLERIDQALDDHRWSVIRDVEAWLDETAAERHAAELDAVADWYDPDDAPGDPLEVVGRLEGTLAGARPGHACPSTNYCRRDHWQHESTAARWSPPWLGLGVVDPCSGYRTDLAWTMRELLAACEAR